MISRPTDASWLSWPRRVKQLADTPVVVLFGGRSGEREVSLESGRAMAAALAEDQPPASVSPVELNAQGLWIVDGVEREAREALEHLPPEALFVLGLHGSPGEDGRMQAFLELCGRRYTGAGPMASATCMDKRRARQAVVDAGVAVAPGLLVSREDWAARSEAALEHALSLGPGPWFIKPNCGGSSLGVARAKSGAELRAGLETALELELDALVEQGQAGLEVTCAVIGNRFEVPVLLPVVEIVPAQGRFFTYDEKYDPQGATEFCPPEHLTPAAAERVQERALAAYRATGCEGYARVDFIVPEQALGGEGEPVFLELNTLPGFTPRSILPLAAAVTGADFRDLCLELCARALARFERNPL
jgi:D-alanine-D-alanine ligase